MRRQARARANFGIVVCHGEPAAGPRSARRNSSRARHQAAPSWRRAAGVAGVHHAEARGAARSRSMRWSTAGPRRCWPEHPAIAQLHTIDRGWKQRGMRHAGSPREWRAAAALRARRYDLLVHLTEHPRGLHARAPAAAALGRDARARNARAPLWRRHFTHFYGCRQRTRAPHGRSRISTRCGASASIPTPPTSGWCWCRVPRPRRASTRCCAQHGLAAARLHAGAPGLALAVQVLARRRARRRCSTASSRDGLAIVVTGAPDARERALVDDDSRGCAAGDARADRRPDRRS